MLSFLLLVSGVAVAGSVNCPAEPSVRRESWRHPLLTEAIRQAYGPARHAATDPVVLAGRSVLLEGKFSYGRASKDLEDEKVVLFARVDGCDWREVGAAITDSDGRARLEMPEALIAPAGDSLEYRWIVPGDLSRVSGTVRTVRPGQPAVVIDIDGTLTTSDGELLDEILSGADPAMYPDAPEVVRQHLREGRLVVYLTGRPYLIRPETLSWLRRKGFPAAPLVTSDSFSETLPGDDAGVERYKLRTLNRLRENGLHWVAAYGNATTDVCAYARAGIDVGRTYIIGEHAGSACAGYGATQALASYTEHLEAWPF